MSNNFPLLLASTSRDHRVRFWNPAIQSVKSRSPRCATVFAFSPDGKRLAASGFLHSLGIFSSTDCTEPLMTCAALEQRSVRCIAWLPKGDKVVVGCEHGSTYIVDARSGKVGDSVMRFSEENNPVTSLAVTPRYLMTLSQEAAGSTLCLWTWAPSGECKPQTAHTLRNTVNTIAAFPDASGRLLVGCTDYAARVFPLSEDGQKLSSRSKKVLVLDHREASDEHEDYNEYDDYSGEVVAEDRGVMSVAVAPNCQTLATGMWSGKTFVWSATTGAKLHVFKPHRKLLRVRSLSFSFDCRLLASGSDGVESQQRKPSGIPFGPKTYEKTICVFDLVTGTEIMSLNNENGVAPCVAFVPPSVCE